MKSTLGDTSLIFENTGVADVKIERTGNASCTFSANVSDTVLISGVTDPVSDQDVATKKYVDDNSGGSVTPAALTRIDDTNVTLTLGGTPATALLQATSITAGWNGQLGLTRGGTGASLTASNGGIVWTTATAFSTLPGTATAGQILQSGASSSPSWSTATYPSTTTANRLLYSSATNTIDELTSANSSVLSTSSTGVPIYLGPLTNGQIIIGSTGATPVAGNITASTGIKVTNTAGGITVKLSGYIATLQYLVVGGGGAGGGAGGPGGGGAGGVVSGTLSSVTINTDTLYTITVGAGGNGSDGGNSSLTGSGLSIPTAVGGGRGGFAGPGNSGGSGGGGSFNNAGGSGTVGQGNNGGAASGDGVAGGGGGGAGGVGANGNNSGPAGNGGNGVSNSITGSAITYGGGGGGGLDGPSGQPNASGGTGGGGTGGRGIPALSGTAGTDGLGGGGGGSPFVLSGGNGGRGVVILRLPTLYYSGVHTGTTTVTTVGFDTVISWSTNGTYTT